MKRLILNTVLVVCFIAFFGNPIFANPTELYEKALGLMQAAKAAGSYTEGYESYKSARENIERILAVYEPSTIASEIRSHRTNIAGFTLEEFRELDGILKLSSEAEEDPLTCAFLLLNEAVPASPYFISRIAEACSETGSDRVLLHIIDKVQTVSSADSRIWLLSAVARQYAFLGQKAKATSLLSEALDEQKKVYEESYGWNDRSAPSSKNKMAVADEDMEMLRRKLWASSASRDAMDRIIGAYVDSGLYPEVFELANSFENKYRKYDAFRRIIEGYVKIKQFRKAIHFLNTNFPDSDNKQSPLTVVARGYAENNELGMALEITEQLSSGRSKTCLMTEIAAKYFELGQDEKALYLLSRTAKAVVQMEDSWYFKGEDLRDISGILADNGRLQEAKRVLSQALEIVSAEDHKGLNVGELSDIAVSFAALGDIEKARRIFKQAIEVANTLGSEKDRELTYITGKYAEAGFFSEAIQSLQLFDRSRAEDLEKSAEPDVPAGISTYSNELKETVWGGFEDEASFEIVESYVKAGMYSEALVLASQIEGEPYRSDAFAEIADAYLDAGQIHRSLEIAITMNPDVQKAMVLMDVSEWYAANGELGKALMIAWTIDTGQENIRDQGFLSMVKRIVLTGELQKCLEISKQIESKALKALALAEIARGFSKEDPDPTEIDKAILRAIVHETQPLSELWKGAER